MVSSTVYGIEELLEQIFGILNGAGFTVWMSHKGTIPVTSQKSNFENCQRSVKRDRVGSKVVPFERFRSPTLSRQ